MQIPPEWTKLPGPAKGIEQDKVEFGCQATGIPQPFYTWVDFHGRDATEKDGYEKMRGIFPRITTLIFQILSLKCCILKDGP